jgi:hypothetical protein
MAPLRTFGSLGTGNDEGPKIMLRSAAIGLSLLAVAWMTPAFAKIANPKEVWESYDIQKIAALARERGDKAEVQTPAGEDAFVKITTAKGLGYIATPAACRAGKCFGLQIVAAFTATPRDLNDYNSQISFSKAFTAEGKTILERYEIADVGIFKGDIDASLTVFEAAMVQFKQYLETPIAPAAAPAKPATAPAPATPKPH